MEVNPLLVTASEAVAVDALLSVTHWGRPACRWCQLQWL